MPTQLPSPSPIPKPEYMRPVIAKTSAEWSYRRGGVPTKVVNSAEAQGARVSVTIANELGRTAVVSMNQFGDVTITVTEPNGAESFSQSLPSELMLQDRKAMAAGGEPF